MFTRQWELHSGRRNDPNSSTQNTNCKEEWLAEWQGKAGRRGPTDLHLTRSQGRAAPAVSSRLQPLTRALAILMRRGSLLGWLPKQPIKRSLPAVPELGAARVPPSPQPHTA